MMRRPLSPGERVKAVRFTGDTMAVDLSDATAEQRRNWQISGAGYGLHRPDLDEDLSTGGLLRGAPAAPEPVRTRA